MTTPSKSTDSPRELRVGYSPCPNDTFIFHGLITNRVDTRGVRWLPHLADVEALNEFAFQRVLPVTKISFHALGHLREKYALLSAGAALGRHCGPLLLTRADAECDLKTARVAIPGRWTSAALLLRLYAPYISLDQLIPFRFDQIPESVADGEVDAGVIIHESRFTYADKGLVSIVDLGEWWEGESGLPIPLGAIIADRRLEKPTLHAVQESLRASVQYARAHPEASRDYVLQHAREIAQRVVDAHIGLYVNDFTEDLGREGLEAVSALFATAESRGIIPACDAPLLLE